MKKSIALQIIISLFFLGAYLDIPLQLTDTFFIPSITNLLLTILLLPFVLKKFNKQDFRFLGTIIMIILSTIVFAGNFYYLSVLGVKIIQFISSIFIGVVLFKLVKLCRRIDFENLMFLVSMLLFLGLFLEYMGLTKGISDSARTFLYQGGSYRLYENAERDIDIAGRVRPQLFTTEPSLVTIGILVSTTSFLLLSNNTKKALLVLLLLFATVPIMASPIVLLNIVVWLIIFFLKYIRSSFTFLLISFCAGVLVLSSGIIVSSFFGDINSRLVAETFNVGTSSYSRIYFPYMIALPNALKHSFLFGAGFGGKNIMAAISGLPNIDVSEQSAMEQFVEGSNAFARYFMYLGILGGLGLLITFNSYLKKKGLQERGLLLVIWILFSQSLGTFETPRYWVYIFFIIGAFYVRSFNKILK